MGHEIIEYRDRHVRLDDMDLWVVRHFLLFEAVSACDDDRSAFILSWEWICPGVYLGIDFGRYFNGECSREQAFLKVLDRARFRRSREPVEVNSGPACTIGPGSNPWLA